MYTELTLFLLGVLGILAHNFIKLGELNKKDKEITLAVYLKTEKFSIIASVIIVLVCVIASHEIKQLQQFGNYLGLGFFTIGYTGQSIIITKLGKLNK